MVEAAPVMDQGYGQQQQGGYDPQAGGYGGQQGYDQQGNMNQGGGVQLPRGPVSRPFVDAEAAGKHMLYSLRS